ncbi:MAG: DoxX family protein [Chloroflexota bacterium]
MNNTDLALLVLRVAVGIVISMHGFMKLGWVGKGGSPAATAGFFQNYLGFRPGIFWAWVAIFAEALGGVLVALGLGGPFPAAAVAADLVVVTIVAHVPKGFWSGNGGWEFPVPLAAGAFAVALIGNGKYSLDGVLGLTYPDSLVGLWWILMVVGVALVLISRAMFAPKAAQKTA